MKKNCRKIGLSNYFLRPIKLELLAASIQLICCPNIFLKLFVIKQQTKDITIRLFFERVLLVHEKNYYCSASLLKEVNIGR